MKKFLLGVNIDYLRMDQALEIVRTWLQKKGKHYVVTPNPEMIVDSKFDKNFEIALKCTDLAIADSSRLAWASKLIAIKNPLIRLVFMPFFLFPKLFSGNDYPITPGTDLMESLISLSQEKGYRTAYLGGSEAVAIKLFKCLRQKYPNLKIVFCTGSVAVDNNGVSNFDIKRNNMTESKTIKNSHSGLQEFNPHVLSEKIDIMFVAFGHIKQEKWIYKNLPKLNTRVMVGVGGAFDYISGSVPRAPKLMRSLGMEWLFRFLIQPVRLKRFWKLPYFVYMVMNQK